MAAIEPEILNRAWNHSLAWDRENSWHSNQKKTCLLIYGKHARQQWEDLSINMVGQTSLLGQDVIVNPSEVTEKQRLRISRAIEAAKKIQRLNLRPDVARVVIGATVLPKMTYGLVPRPVPKKLIQHLRTCVKEALSKTHRQHSWDALCLVTNPGHQVDPMAYLAYSHLNAVLLGLRSRKEAAQLWEEFWRQDHYRSKIGPFRTAKYYLDLLRVEMTAAYVWSFEGQEIHLLRDDVKKTQHKLRQAIRAMFCRQAARTRPHLQGLEDTKIELSRKLSYKPGHPFRAELISLLCDGLWLNRKRWLAGLIDSPDCPYCWGGRECQTSSVLKRAGSAGSPKTREIIDSLDILSGQTSKIQTQGFFSVF